MTHFIFRWLLVIVTDIIFSWHLWILMLIVSELNVLLRKILHCSPQLIVHCHLWKRLHFAPNQCVVQQGLFTDYQVVFLLHCEYTLGSRLVSPWLTDTFSYPQTSAKQCVKSCLNLAVHMRWSYLICSLIFVEIKVQRYISLHCKISSLKQVIRA